ncbi:hypothetical protein A4S06_01870 [Erysipelotrichaceae bacterium MTC7]|nr:hypothetical protein A4S06_01870 [Erysipelotrichaceae bacterium MTC7]
MLIKKLETNEEYKQIINMKASSSAQNGFLKEILEQGKFTFDNILIMVDDRCVVGRALLHHNNLNLLTFESDVPEAEATNFVQQCLTHLHGDVEVHLYSDKINHDSTRDALLSAGFMIMQKKYSYVSTPTIQTSFLQIKTANTANREDFLQAFIAVSKDNLDTSIRLQNERYGINRGSEMLLEAIEVHKKDPSAWMLAYHDEQLVGFVIVTITGTQSAGISYIGVLPEHRGHGYAKELLHLASTYCARHHIVVLVADTDEENIPMQRALNDTLYTYSCSELVFFKQV